jgi:hypothetical protein
VEIFVFSCSLLFLYAVCVYLLLYVLNFLIGCAGSVGIFLASRVTYIFVCVSLRCAECRAGTSIFGLLSGVEGGTVRIFYFLWLCSGGYGTIEMVRGLVRVFLHFLQFAVSSLGGWICAVGILRYIFCW